MGKEGDVPICNMSNMPQNGRSVTLMAKDGCEPFYALDTGWLLHNMHDLAPTALPVSDLLAFVGWREMSI